MIDNRGLTVLAQVTAEEYLDWFANASFDELEIDAHETKLAEIIETALREAFKRGCEDCRVRNFESEGEKS
jgi:hypothetical protein